MLQPVRAKHPPPPPLTLVRKQPPPTSASSSSTTNSLDFSIKTLDQIRAEKRRKQQLQQQKTDGDEAARRESEVAGGIEDEQTNRTTATTTMVLVPQGGDRDDALKEERPRGEEGEGDSGKELPKVVAPWKPRKRVVIKRSTLHKNADSALSSTAESAKSSDPETSDLAPSPKKKRMTEETSTSESQALEPCFDATCIDRSAPLPDNHQEQRESKLTITYS